MIKHHIGHQPKAEAHTTFTTINPATGEANPWRIAEATPAEADQAAQAAATAFDVYKAVPGPQRASFLRAIADAIEALGDSLTDSYCAESGLPRGRAEGERRRTTGQLRAFAQLVEEGSWVEATLDSAQPDRQPAARPSIRKMQVPIGPVLVFGASNFPLAFSTAGGDTASALAAGCPVVVKAHPAHAHTSALVAGAVVAAAQASGMPDGVFSHLLCSEHQVGLHLVRHPAIKAVGFTGSLLGGRALFDAAAQRPDPIPVFAEMGSVNPVVVLPSALRPDPARWAAPLAGSITTGVGQFCTKPGLLFGVEGPDWDAFAEALATHLRAVAPAPMLHEGIRRRFVEDWQATAAQDGVDALVQSPAPEATQGHTGSPVLLSVSGEDFLANPKLHHEVFGPYALLVRCRHTPQLQAAIQALEGQLTGTILADEADMAAHGTLVAALAARVGRLLFNGVPTGVEVCPAMMHGGPYPASTDSRFTAVGTHAIRRWTRPLAFQGWPDALLPPALQDANPLGIKRQMDGVWGEE